MDRLWYHEHLGTVFRGYTTGELWMLVSVNETEEVHFRTRRGDLLKCTMNEFAACLRRGDYEETNEVW